MWMGSTLGTARKHHQSWQPWRASSTLSLVNKNDVMSFTNKPTVTLTLDQVVELVDQLSPADKLKVAKRIQKRQRSKDIDRLVEIFSKVKISEKQLTAMVEEERAKIHAREQARPARR